MAIWVEAVTDRPALARQPRHRGPPTPIMDSPENPAGQHPGLGHPARIDGRHVSAVARGRVQPDDGARAPGAGGQFGSRPRRAEHVHERSPAVTPSRVVPGEHPEHPGEDELKKAAGSGPSNGENQGTAHRRRVDDRGSLRDGRLPVLDEEVIDGFSQKLLN